VKQRAFFSVIVPAYNAESTLEGCLTALESQTVDRELYEVILVDDGSTDGTADIAQQHGVRIFSQPNAGPAAARNSGADMANGEILLFTDADCEPAPDWIERLAVPFENPNIVGAKGAYRTRQRELVARFVQLEYEDRYSRTSRLEHIDFIDTYSAAYRREVLITNQGFDTSFPTASVEDQELSFRLARKGYRMAFVPDAIVYHQHDRTITEYWKRKFKIGYWKALLLRWYPERAVQDSHTPQVVKAQIGLAGLSALALAASVLYKPALWLALTLSGLFALSAGLFIARTTWRDPAVGVIALPMVAVRSVALGLGLTIGFLTFLRTDHSGRRRDNA
jgi:cellulose synthase/poly-beta-1,6-N-acetylglucosamine synthase-like glycosyltransferase